MSRPEIGFVEWFFSHSPGKIAAGAAVGWSALRMFTGVVDTFDFDGSQPLVEHSFAEIMDKHVDSTPFEEGLVIFGGLGICALGQAGFRRAETLRQRPHD